MPDVTLCRDYTCPSRWTCYRYMAVPDEHQSWSDFEFDRAGRDKCDSY